MKACRMSLAFHSTGVQQCPVLISFIVRVISFILQAEDNESFFHSPDDPQVNCLKNNFKIYIKINIKTANFSKHV
jgi:hypothetical protein